MVTNYPSFEDKKTREDYSEKIKDIFVKNHFNWDASPSFGGPYVFVRQNLYRKYPPLNTEAHNFPNVVKVGVSTKEGIARIGIISYPSMNDSKQMELLEKKGYSKESIDNQENIFLLVKPLDGLELIVKELKGIKPILLNKK
jgi:hypothetical protein